MENSMKVPSKIKNRTLTWSVNPILGYISKGIEIRISKEIFTVTVNAVLFTVAKTQRAWQLTLVFLPGESPWTEQPGGLQSLGLKRVGHNRSDWTRMQDTEVSHHFVDQGLSSQSYAFSSESWTIKKAERQRIFAFKLWCWRRLLRVHWTAGRWNQSILKEINPDYPLEGLTLKLKLQYFSHLIRRLDSLEKPLMLGKIEVGAEVGDRGWDGWMASLTQQTWVWANSRRWWRKGKPGVL